MKTIKASSEITYLFEHGRRVSTPDISLIVLRNEKRHDLEGRVAFIAGKKLGNAVWRNRAKRRMRAVCQDLGGPFSGWDVVFLARRKVTESDYRDLREHTRHALERSHIISR